MTQVLFVTGWCESEQAYQGLIDYIQMFYTSRLPKGTPFYTTRWDKDVADTIHYKYPVGDLCLIGFSFGGQAVLDAIAKIAPRPVKKLILIDPVDCHNPNFPNTKGFAIPPNVQSAICYYRTATQMPWSGHITSPDITNQRYNPDPSKPIGDQHGQMVWSGDVMNMVKSCL